MKKNICVILAVLLLCSSFCGCAAFKRKFVRKPQDKKKTQPQMQYIPTEEYEATISSDLIYQKYYAYWKSMEEELMLGIGLNYKRDRMCYQNALRNLLAMQKYLVPEKAAQLQPYIDRLETIYERYEASHESYALVNRTKRFLEVHLMNVERYFRYGKVKDYLRHPQDK